MGVHRRKRIIASALAGSRWPTSSRFDFRSRRGRARHGDVVGKSRGVPVRFACSVTAPRVSPGGLGSPPRATVPSPANNHQSAPAVRYGICPALPYGVLEPRTASRDAFSSSYTSIPSTRTSPVCSKRHRQHRRASNVFSNPLWGGRGPPPGTRCAANVRTSSAAEATGGTSTSCRRLRLDQHGIARQDRLRRRFGAYRVPPRTPANGKPVVGAIWGSGSTTRSDRSAPDVCPTW